MADLDFGHSIGAIDWSDNVGQSYFDFDFSISAGPANSNAGVDESGNQPAKQGAVVRRATAKSAAGKKITADLDKEDELIYDLKRQGWHDDRIADQLKKAGYTDYKPASIASRYGRICKKVQAKNDELLDEDLTDWHDGEDEVLLRAVADSEARIAKEVEEVRGKLYFYAAQQVNQKTNNPRFSQRACRQRHEGLMDGSARPPTETDDDPETRRQDTAQRKANFTANKAAERARLIEDLKSGKLHGTEKTQAELLVAQDKELSSTLRKQIQAEEAIRRAERQREAKEAAARRRENVSAYRESEADKRKTKNREKEILKELAKSVEKSKAAKEAAAAKLRAEERRQAAKSNRPLPAMFVDAPPSPSPPPPPSHPPVDVTVFDLDAAAATPAPQKRAATSAFLSRSPSPLPPSKRQRLLSTPSKPHFAIPDEANLDPRTIMSKNELMALASERGMSKNREKETKDLLARRLRDSDMSAPMDKILEWAAKRGLSTAGVREEVVWRIVEFDARGSREWRPRHMAILQRGRDKMRNALAAENAEKERKHGGGGSGLTGRIGGLGMGGGTGQNQRRMIAAGVGAVPAPRKSILGRVGVVGLVGSRSGTPIGGVRGGIAGVGGGQSAGGDVGSEGQLAVGEVGGDGLSQSG